MVAFARLLPRHLEPARGDSGRRFGDAFPRKDTRFVQRFALVWWPYLALLAMVAGWKLVYFGSLLPNTYYAKSAAGLLTLKAGAAYSIHFLRLYGRINLLLGVMPL